MIAKLTGLIDSFADGAVVIDVRGVGYLVSCSQRTLSAIAESGAVSLLIETQVREDAISLYGFAQADERAWFRRLITVQGVGAKAALAILSVVPPDRVAAAILAGDRAALSRAPGVGVKLAARIIAELRDDAAIAAPASIMAASGSGGTVAPAGEAVSALVNLGFSTSEATDAVMEAAQMLGAAASVEALIAGGLARLAPKEHRA
jgi:Holliday junction DNA helicase RuvA